MRFYADENFPFPVVVELRKIGHDVLTVFEDGRANKSVDDEAVLARASKLNRSLLTINRIDFKRLHNTEIAHAGLVLCTFDLDFIGQAERIDSGETEGRSGTLSECMRPHHGTL